MKAAVSPWDSSLVPVDVFRSPLGRVFSLLEEIRDHVYTDRYRTFLNYSSSSYIRSRLKPELVCISFPLQRVGDSVSPGDGSVARVTPHAVCAS